MAVNWTEALGLVAAACTTLSFVPQLVKIRKQGGRDLSYLMLLIYFAGLVLWLVYGLRLRAPAIIVANVVGIVLVGAAIILKVRATGSPDSAPESRPDPTSGSGLPTAAPACSVEIES